MSGFSQIPSSFLSTTLAVVAYSRKVGRYFQYSICRSVSFVNWKTSCNNATHQANAARLNKTIDNNPKIKPSFVNLPPEDGPEKVCFHKLRTAKEGNLEKKCKKKRRSFESEFEF